MIILTGLLAISGCRPGRDIGDEYLTTQKPLALLPVRQITGTILGHDLSQPRGLTADRFGNIYLVDAGNNRIIRFDTALTAIRDVGGFGTTAGSLQDPTYIALGNDLSLFIADAGNQRLAQYNSRLNYVDQISLIDDDEPLKFGRPAGIRIDRYGDIWICEEERGRVSVLNNIGSFDRFLGGVESSTGLLMNPAGIADDGDQRVFVCDAGQSLIQVFDDIGVDLYAFGREVLKEPTGVAVDRYGQVWVVDAARRAVFCFHPRGELLFSSLEAAGASGDRPVRPFDLALAGSDRLIVSDAGGGRLIVYKILYPEE